MLRLYFIPVLSVIVLMTTCRMARANEKPSAWLCLQARGAVLIHGSEKAAEDAARARGVSEETIRLAKRCKR